ncbi:MAG: metalloregulator ArsR/SmtB family transcription factor [Pseudomonadota bacterium]
MDRLIDQLKAAGEPTRMRILALLREDDLSVGELVQILGQSQPRLSHHLKVLSTAGLVERLPEGAWVFYRLASSADAVSLLAPLFARIDAEPGDTQRDGARLKAIRQARSSAAEAYFASVAGTWDTVRSLHYPNEAIEAAIMDLAGVAEGAAPAFDRIIDLGTGTGRMLAILAPHARQVEGLDLSHHMLNVARANLEAAGIANARVRHGDAAATPFETASADLVILHQVLHFIDNPAAVLAEADRLLKPGGRLIVVDFAPHTLEFLRENHGHRRLGIRAETMADWVEPTALALSHPRRFDPPAGMAEGLSVQIWTADKPAGQTADASPNPTLKNKEAAA